MDDDMSFATIWEAVAAAVPDAEAIVWGDAKRSYGDLQQRAARLATAFSEFGIGPGSVVGFYLYNRPEYLDALFAAFKVRAVPANVNFRYLEGELAYLIDNAGLELLVYPTSLADRIADAIELVALDPILVAIDDGGHDPVAGSLMLEDLITGAEPQDPIVRSSTDLLMVYTGGTTGMPKGVQWQQRDSMVAAWTRYAQQGYIEPTSATEAGTLARRLHDDNVSSTTIAAPPLIHGTGMWTALGGLTTGQTIGLLASRSFDPAELCRLIERRRADSLTIVGDAFARPIVRELARAEDAGEPYDLSSLKRISSSGVMWSAPMKRELHQRCSAVFIDGLSASEGAGFASMITHPGDDPETARFVLGERSLVIGDDGRPVEVGAVGRIAVAGSIPLGYRNDDERTVATFQVIDGVRYSIPGDFARLEEAGVITLLGRGSVCINTAGEKVYPEEVEEAVKALVSEVDDCVVVGATDPDRGEAVCAVVSRSAAGEGLSDADVEAAVRTTLRSAIAGYKVPRRVVVVDRVTRAPSGKADYRWAKSMVEGVVESAG